MAYNKRKHLYSLLDECDKHITNLEFNIYELKTVREGFRLERDKIVEAKSALEQRVVNLGQRNAEGDVKEIKDVKNKIDEIDKSIKSFESQITEVDQVVDGFDYTDPEGVQRHHDGVLEKIGKINTKKEMLKEYISNL